MCLLTDTAMFVFPGCTGDWDHKQISPEAVWELGFCQRQAAVQILPERSGRAAAQTVAPLEGSRRDGGGRDSRCCSPRTLSALTASALAWSFRSSIHKHTYTIHTHTRARLCTNVRSMHIGMHRHTNTPSYYPWPLNNCCLGRNGRKSHLMFSWRGPLYFLWRGGGRVRVVSGMTLTGD